MKNRYDSEQTVNDIIEVATKLFTEKGFDKTSIQDIVNGLEGLTRGAIYHHFASKDEIMIAVIRKRLPLTDVYLAEKLKHQRSAKDKLKYLLIQSLTPLDAHDDHSILAKNPKIFMEVLRIDIEVVAPQIKGLLDEANRDGDLGIENTQQVSEVIMLLIGTWFTKILYPDSDAVFNDKLKVLQQVFMGLGLDLLDDATYASLLR